MGEQELPRNGMIALLLRAVNGFLWDAAVSSGGGVGLGLGLVGGPQKAKPGGGKRAGCLSLPVILPKHRPQASMKEPLSKPE